MKISSLQGNKDELLVLGSWKDLVRIFDSSRAFLIDKSNSLFGIYLCKQECAEFLNKLIHDIDCNEWEDFRVEKSTLQNQIQA